jgi:recombination associated protein RdgC
MTSWLHDGDKLDTEDRQGFDLDRDCELKSTDELRSVVRYGKHPLDVDNVREHIKAGKVATKLALTWRGRVSFVLNESMQLRMLSFLDVVFEAGAARIDDKAEAFEADVAIFTGEMTKLIPDLVEALGGEAVAMASQE